MRRISSLGCRRAAGDVSSGAPRLARRSHRRVAGGRHVAQAFRPQIAAMCSAGLQACKSVRTAKARDLHRHLYGSLCRLHASGPLPPVELHVVVQSTADSCGCGRAPDTPAAASVPAKDSYRHDVVQIEMRNVRLHLEEGIVLDVTRCAARWSAARRPCPGLRRSAIVRARHRRRPHVD